MLPFCHLKLIGSGLAFFVIWSFIQNVAFLPFVAYRSGLAFCHLELYSKCRLFAICSLSKWFSFFCHLELYSKCHFLPFVAYRKWFSFLSFGALFEMSLFAI